MGIEIERKFLVNFMPENLPRGVYICQGYMLNQPEKVVRIRTMGDKGFLTVKGKTVNALRKEFEYEIPLADARQMQEEFCPPPLVKKTRFTIPYNGFEWVIDRFEGENSGLILAEIELDHEAQPFEKPSWAGKEVTQYPRYFNSNLIARPYSTW